MGIGWVCFAWIGDGGCGLALGGVAVEKLELYIRLPKWD